MEIKSSSFKSKSAIPIEYTCDGKNINPDIKIIDVPAETRTLALIMDNPDDAERVHWVVWNIPPNYSPFKENKNTKIKKGKLPDEATEGKNENNKNFYEGPCEPGFRHYRFRVFALDNKPNIPPDCTKEALEKAMKGHIIGKAELVGLYGKNIK